MSNSSPPTLLRRLYDLLGWSRHSGYLFCAFVLVTGLVLCIWWPLAVNYVALVDWQGAWWSYVDWLLAGVWLAMVFLVMARADIRRDARIVLVSGIGGLVIEAWGTQTELWVYYTSERPPIWIIPAWPISTLAIDRLTRLLAFLTRRLVRFRRAHLVAYALAFCAFYVLMLRFVAPTFDKSLTWMSLAVCALVIATPTDARTALLTFVAGSGLGYFLELWGTTRHCWNYYTLETPPLFAVLAHGLAATAFWRAGLLLEAVFSQMVRSVKKDRA